MKFCKIEYRGNSVMFAKLFKIFFAKLASENKMGLNACSTFSFKFNEHKMLSQMDQTKGGMS